MMAACQIGCPSITWTRVPVGVTLARRSPRPRTTGRIARGSAPARRGNQHVEVAEFRPGAFIGRRDQPLDDQGLPCEPIIARRQTRRIDTALASSQSCRIALRT